jgi:hypothetical protein
LSSRGGGPTPGLKRWVAVIAAAALAGGLAACGGNSPEQGAEPPRQEPASAPASSSAAPKEPKNWVEENCPLGEFEKGDGDAEAAARVDQERCIGGEWGAYLQATVAETNSAGWNMYDDIALWASAERTTLGSGLLEDALGAYDRTPWRVRFLLRQTSRDTGEDDPRAEPRQVTISNVRVGTKMGEGDHTVLPIEEVALPNPDPPSLLWQAEADDWNRPFLGREDMPEHGDQTVEGRYSLAAFGKLPEVSDYNFDISAFGKPWAFGGAEALTGNPKEVWADHEERVVVFLLPSDSSDWTLIVFDIAVNDGEPETVATWVRPHAEGAALFYTR